MHFLVNNKRNGTSIIWLLITYDWRIMGNVEYKTNHQKRKITCYADWLEAFTNYGQPILNYLKCWTLYKHV